MSDVKKGGAFKKAFIVILLLGLAGGGWWAWQQPAIRQQVEDYRWIHDHAQPDLHQGVEWWDGEIVKVLDGNWVYVKIKEGFVYALRLRGLEAPTLAIRLSDDTLTMGQEAKTFLEERILKNPVRFQSIEMSDIRYGHGYVEWQGASIILPMVESGMARLKRSEITHFSRETILELFAAERRAKEAGRGVWKEGVDINWTVGDYAESNVVPGV